MSAVCRVGMCREVPAGGMLAYRCIGVGVHLKRKEESRKGAASFSFPGHYTTEDITMGEAYVQTWAYGHQKCQRSSDLNRYK